MIESDSNPTVHPLHCTLDVHYSLGAVEALLGRGVDPNGRAGALGETALHVAVRRRRLEPLDALVAAGAELDAETAGGMTAYRHALRRGFTEVVDKLAALGAKTATTPSDEVALALLRGEHDRAAELLAGAPDLVRDAGPEEARLLPDLAGHARIDAMRVLLDAGADIAARGLDDGTALHQAGWFGQPAAARFLIEHGAPLDLRGDVHDSTPLGWVTHGSRYSGGAAERVEVYVELAEILLAAGAPFPADGEVFDREQHAEAVPRVLAVLRSHGWTGSPSVQDKEK